MKRLLTLLLLAAGSASGQIENPPSSVNIVDATETGRAVLTATNPAAAATAIGLGTTNEVIFEKVETKNMQITDGTNIAIDLSDDVAEFFSQIDVRNENGISFTATNAAATTRTNLGLGGTNTATFGNVILNADGNLAPSQTAASASSLMTRGLVGQEFVNPRNKFQTTYWFGLEGIGLWQSVNSANASTIGNRGPRWGTSLGIFGNTINNRSAVTAAGFGLRLGAGGLTGAGAWRPSDGGAFVLQTQIVNYFSGSGANQAFGFYLGVANNTNFWGNSDAIGIWYVAQPTNTWQADTAFAQHTRIAASNVVFTVSTAGTTTNTAPSFPDLINSLVTNGTAVFRNLGPHTSNNWVLARGSTNASEVLMTNTAKSNWVRPSGVGHEALLKLRYGTNTAAPFTFFATVTDGAGESAEVSIDALTNTFVSPQYWMRWDSTNTVVGNDAAGIRYFSIDAQLPPLTTP